jgi:hypothetical protein
LGVFAGSDFGSEFFHISEFLSASSFIKEGVSLGEDFVFKTDSSDVSLF